MYRYLINFSYIGTRFSGVARQPKQFTVCNVIENCISHNLKSICELKSNVYVSSRTDAGVHALSNTAHLDLSVKFPYDILDVQRYLNNSFVEHNFPIRILNFQRVSPDFISRHAKSRTYFYRLGLIKNGKALINDYHDFRRIEAALYPESKFIEPSSSFFSITNFVNSLETNFITEVKEPFDYHLFLRALNLFNGQHNFSAFTTSDGRLEMSKMKRCPIKSVKIKVRNEITQFLTSNIHNFDDKYDIIEVEISANSFLYKMIRKMVGAAVDVARGMISLKKIEKMMLCPPDYYGAESTTVLKPNGLFLKKVVYENQGLLIDK